MNERHLRVRIDARDEAALEIALAEAFEAGARGFEEAGAEDVGIDEAGGEQAAEARSAIAYVTAGEADAVVAAVDAVRGASARDAGAVAERAWSDAWKEGLDAVLVSPRLCVRPPFAEAPAGFTGDEIVIEPAQAFGTGHHASTRLALAMLDAVRARLAGARVLDVGCGSGVLALAASMLGAWQVVAHDVDPLSGAASGRAVRAHGRDGSVHVFTGPVEALAGSANAGFDGIVANLIRSELEPLLADFARLVRPRGWLIVSGLLAHERERFTAGCAEAGFLADKARSEAEGGDTWLSLAARRG